MLIGGSSEPNHPCHPVRQPAAVDRRRRAGEAAAFERAASVWRGDDETAVFWTAQPSPMLLLWSNAAMSVLAADYEKVLDAPASAARKSAIVKENGTKF